MIASLRREGVGVSPKDVVPVLLAECGELPPVADVVDRAEFTQVVLLDRTQGTDRLPVIVPVDHAQPDLVRAWARTGWPPTDETLTEARSGFPLVAAWRPAAREARVRPLVEVEVDDVEKLAVDPHVVIAGRRQPLTFGPTEVKELRTTRMIRTATANGTPVRLRLTDMPPTFGRTRTGIAERELASKELPVTLPRFPVGVALVYEQQWHLNGYLRGELLNSIPLTPQEEATIEIFEWDRKRRSEDLSTELSREQDTEALVSEKATSEAIRDLAKAEAFMLTSAGVNVLGVSANIAGEFGSKVNDQSKQTTQQINEASEKAAARVRDQRQMKVSEAREWGFEQRTTRKLKNANLGRSLNAFFFEVLAEYTIETRVIPARAQLVVLVDSPVTVRLDDPSTVLAWEGVLRRSLRDEALVSAFESVRWLAAAALHAANVEQRRSLIAPAPIVSESWEQAAAAIKEAVDSLSAASHYVASAFDGFRDANGRDPTQGEIAEAIESYHQWVFRRFGLEQVKTDFWSSCKRFADTWEGDKSLLHLKQFLLEVRSALGVVAESTIILIFSSPATVLATLGLGGELGIKAGWYAQWFGLDDAGLGPTIENARRIASKLESSQAPTGEDKTQTPPAADPYPFEQQAGHVVRAQALYAHLQANRDAYRAAIWDSLAPGDQRRMLASVLGKFANLVVLDVVAYHYDQLALPLRLDAFPQLQQRLARMRELLAASAVAERETTLPVKGLLVESSLGRCNALEPFLEEHRGLDLDDKRAKIRLAVADALQHEAELDRVRKLLEEDKLDDPHAPSLPTVHVRILQDDE